MATKQLRQELIDNYGINQATGEFRFFGDGGDASCKIVLIDDLPAFVRIVDGVEQLTGISLAATSVKLGQNVSIAVAGDSIISRYSDGTLGNIFAKTNFSIAGGNTGPVTILRLFDFQTREVTQSDNTGTFTGTTFEYSFVNDKNQLVTKLYHQTGATAATDIVTVEVYNSLDDTGPIIFKKDFPASFVPADTEVEFGLDGFFEYEIGTEVFVRVSSAAAFSIKTNAAVTAPWRAIDYFNTETENILAICEFVDGTNYSRGDWLIDPDTKKIYVCNFNGIQTGTFAANIDKWDVLSSNEVAVRNQTTGLLQGGIISQASATTIDWTSGHGVVVDYLDPENPIIYDVRWDAVTGYTPTNIATDGVTLFAYDKTGSLVEVLSTDLILGNAKDLIFFGSVNHASGSIYSVLTAPGNVGYRSGEAFNDFINLIIGPANVSGNIYGPNGANMTIDVVGGSAFMIGSNFRNNPRLSDIVSLGSLSALTFTKIYRSADPSETILFDGVPTTLIDPTKWDDGSGVLQTVTTDYWTIQRIFRSRTGITFVAYGQQEFASLALALEALGSEPFEEKNPLEFMLFRSSLVVQQSATDLSDTAQAEFFEQSSFRVFGAQSASSTIPGITVPGGNDRDIQFNDGGSFGGSDNFKYIENAGYSTIRMESLTAAGGCEIVFNNSSALERVALVYDETLNQSFLESVNNNLKITSQNTLTFEYGSCFLTLEDTTGNNSLNILSSASNKDVNLNIKDHLGSTIFKVEHNDVSGQTSLDILNDAATTKFAITYNQTLDDIFLSSGTDLYVTSASNLFIESGNTLNIEALGNYRINLINDEATLIVGNSATNYALSYTNTLGHTVPLLIFSKTGLSGGAFQVFTSTGDPEGVITANGGDLCVRDAGTSSELYIKLSDGVNTGWQKLLHGTSGVQGPGTTTDNAVATWDGTTGLSLNNSYVFIESTANDTRLYVDTVTAIGQASMGLRNSSSVDRFLINYNETLNLVSQGSSGNAQFVIASANRLTLEANNVISISALGDYNVGIRNDQSIFTITGSSGSYSFAFSNTEPNTEPLLVLAKDHVTGGVTRLYVSNTAPEGVITASGGELCVVNNGTSSNIYLKLSNATNTDWQSLLGDVIGATSSLNNTIALSDGTTGKKIKYASYVTVNESVETELRLKSQSATVGSQIILESFAGGRLTIFEYNEIALRTTLFLSGTDHSFRLDSNGALDLRTFSDDTVTINNDNASYKIYGSLFNYRHEIVNNQANTNPIIRFTQSGLNGGTFDIFISSVAPEGIITAEGGNLCIRDSGTSSDLYIKRTDTGNTGWVDLLHSASGVTGPGTTTDNAIATWDGINGLSLNDSYASVISNANDTKLSVTNVSATGESGFEIKTNTGFARYSLTYNQSTNQIFMTTNSGASYSNVVDGSLEHLSFSNVAIGSFTNNLVELYNAGATFRVDVSANGNRLYYTNATADTFAMLHLAKLGTNGGTINMFTTSRTPLGNITANGGDIAFRDAGTSSNFYLKRVDGGTTGWNVGVTKANESSTLNSIAYFDTATGNSITDAPTATIVIGAVSTAIDLKPVTSAGNAELNFRSTSSAIQAEVFYDEDVDTFNIETQTSLLNIGNFAGPIRFESSSVTSELHLINYDPGSSLFEPPGSVAIRVSTDLSSLHINTGEASGRVWSRCTLDSDFNAYGGFGRLQNRIRWSEDLTNAVWVDGLGNTTIIPGATTGPNGELVDNVQWDSAGLGLRQSGLGIVQGNTYTVSFWAKLISGANNILIIDLSDGGAFNIFIETNGWQRYYRTLTAGAGGGWLDFTHNSTSTFAIWGVQVNDGSDLYPYLRTEDIARKDTTDYGVAIDGKFIFAGSSIDSNHITTNLTTGVLDGGLLSINGVDDSLIDVTAGSALIADYSTPGAPNIRKITWAAQTVDPVLGATEFIKWIGVQESATPGVGEFVFDIEFTQLEKRTIAIVGRCWGDGVTDSITAVGQYTTTATGQGYVANDLSYVLGSMNKRGNVFSANGANLLLNKTAGVSYRYAASYLANPTAPHVHTDSAQTGITTYWYLLQNSLVADIQPDIDPDNWDDGGTKTAVPSGKYTLQRLYYYPVSQLLAPTYGQELFDSIGEAIGTAGEDIVETPQELLEGAILRGWIALKQGATALNDSAQALFKEARSIGDQPAKGTVGSTLSYRNYTVADIGGAGIHYYAGFYQAPASSVTLTIGGTVTQVYGIANIARGAHAFCVASGPGGTNLVLTVSGTSITDLGVRTTSDSEIIVADTDQATTNQYFETTKKWLGQITYTLTGAAGSFTFNYGFAKYDDFGNRNFTITDFQVTGQGAASETALDIRLMHHKPTGWTYSAGAFVPGTGFVVSLANDYGTDDNLSNGVGFAYKRINLSTFVNGEGLEGLLVRFSTATNNSISSATIEVGALI